MFNLKEEGKDNHMSGFLDAFYSFTWPPLRAFKVLGENVYT